MLKILNVEDPYQI